MVQKKVVTPVKTGGQKNTNSVIPLDSGFRRNDGRIRFVTFCEVLNLNQKGG